MKRLAAVLASVVLVALALERAAAAPAMVAEPVTLDNVLAFVAAHPEVSTIDDLLGSLPATYRAGYTLMYRSSSLQAASPDAPRVILYGTDASLMIAFGGDPAAERGDILEMIQYHPDGATFEFRELQFPEGRAQPPAVQVSARDPALCVSCHGADLRPNWEHYDNWPGAFGSRDDVYRDEDASLKGRLDAFLARADALPRYRRLLGVKDGYSDDGFRTKVPHNIILTQHVAQHNFQQIARLMRATPEFDRYQFAVLGSVWCPADIAAFFPPKLRDAYQPYLARIAADANEDRVFRYLFEARGIAVLPWLLDFVTPVEQKAFTTPGLPSHEFTGPVVDGSPALAPFFTVTDGTHRGAPSRLGEVKDCAGLKAKSLEALAPLAGEALRGD